MDGQLYKAGQYKYLCSDGTICTWDELIDGLDADLVPKCRRDFALYLSCLEAKPIVMLDASTCAMPKLL